MSPSPLTAFFRYLGVAVFALMSSTMPVAPLRASEAPTVIRFGLSPGDNSGPGYYAQELGLFKKAGLDVQITTLASGPLAAQSVAAGALDIGTGNVATIAAARLRGIPLRFIAASAVSTSATLTDEIIVAKDSPYKTAADLNGKTFGVNALKALGLVSTSSWMDKHGGDSKTIKFVELGFPEMGNALDSHRIDAADDVEPYLTNAKNSVRVLGSAIDGLAPKTMLLGFFAQDTWLTAHPEAAAKFVAALHQAAEWANAHKRESGVILSHFTKIDPEIIAVMGRAVYSTALEPATIQPVIDEALKYGIIDQHMQASDLIWKP